MTGAVLMHCRVPELVGTFNENYRAGQAVDYLLRMEKYGIICKKLEMISVMRRLHATNTSRIMKNRQFRDYGTILRAGWREIKDMHELQERYCVEDSFFHRYFVRNAENRFVNDLKNHAVA